MTQQSDRHLTTEQLSALLDEQLSDEERAACETHLRGCRQCRSALADLRQTVALLRALPEPTLPRSFTLPGNLTYLRERSKPSVETPVLTTTTIAQQRRPTPLKRPLRILSTLVAVIGLFFLVSSVITMLPHATSGSAPSSTSNTAAPASAPGHTGTFAAQQKTGVAENPHATSATPGHPTPTPSVSPTTTPTTSENEHKPSGASPPALPPPALPLPSLSTPLGLQEVGFTLLILGILGLIFTRRRRSA